MLPARMLPDRLLTPAAALLIAALPLAAPAQQAGGTTANDFTLACRFAQECRETGPCAGSAFELSVEGRQGGLGAGVILARARLSSGAGAVETFGTRGADALFLQGGNAGSRHSLTVAAGAARYTVHLGQGPAIVSYFGTCE